MNQITEFPALPDGIEWFWCSRNPLVRVPHLPAGLTNFAMGDTQMSSMPALPDTLTALSVTNCGLTTLPDSWPPALEQLLLNNNRLTHIPPLPSTLKICSLDNNQLTELPDNYMAMQHPHAVIYIRENPLSEDVQQLIQELRDDSASRPFINNRPDPDDEADDGWAFDSGSDSDDETRPLTEAVESWYSLDQWEAVQAQWQAFTHEPQADEFSRFIDRLAMSLQATEPTLREAFHAAVATWLDRLAHDAELRADTFAFAEEAGTTCADRAALSFLQMTRLRAVHDVTAGRYDQAPVALLGVARSILRQEALERLAEERVTARPTDEEIEVYLAFLTQRSERLQLSLELTEMTFPQLGEVTDQELDQAAAAVEALDDTLPHFLSNWEPWRSVLQRWDPELFQAAQDRLYNSLDNGVFEAHARTQGFVGPAAAQALYHDVFGPLTQAYLKDKGLSL
jgi:E3 ubiquitin-protein ligase SspH2